MAAQIRRQFRCGDGYPAALRGIKTVGKGKALRVPTRFANLTFFLDHMPSLFSSPLQHHPQLQRTMVTVVPVVAEDSISNSLTSRRAPDSPRPSPPPDVQPSVSASSRFGIPGP